MKTMWKICATIVAAALLFSVFTYVPASAATETGTLEEYTVAVFDPGRGVSVDRIGRYEGAVKDGVPNGKGTLYLTNDSGTEYTFSGTSKNGVPDGNFVFEFDMPEGKGRQEITETYKNGKIKSYVLKYQDEDSNWMIIEGRKIGKEIVVTESYPDGLRQTAHISETKGRYTDSFDSLYLDSTMGAESGVYMGMLIDDEMVFDVQKARNLSKKSLKSKAIPILGTELADNIDDYAGQPVKVSNLGMKDAVTFADPTNGNEHLFSRVIFTDGYVTYYLYSDPDLVNYGFGKFVDVYFVPISVALVLNTDGTTGQIVNGWILKKPVKSEETEAAFNLFRKSDKKYEEMKGTFSGTMDENVPNGLGSFTFEYEGVKYRMSGNFVDGEPLNGIYSICDTKETHHTNYTYKDGLVTDYAEYTVGPAGEEIITYHVGSDGKYAAFMTTDDEPIVAWHETSEKIGERVIEPVDTFFDTLILSNQKAEAEEYKTEVPIYSYFLIDSVCQQTKKEIRKAAKKASALDIFADTAAYGTGVSMVKNLKVTEVEAVSINDDGLKIKITEVKVEADGVVFDIMTPYTKKFKAGDTVTAYITTTGTLLDKEDGKTYVVAYAYDLKKQK